MRFPNWFGSIHFLFSKKHRRIHAWQKYSCSRTKEQQDQRIVEPLEQRRLLAFDLAAAYVIDSEQFNFGTEPLGTHHLIDESPQQITLQFTPNTVVDPTSLASGISIVRSGGIRPNGDPDPFLVDASAAGSQYPDVRVEPGAVLVDDLPTQNQVVIRFADRLPDDLYRITLSSGIDSESGLITGLKTLPTTTSRDGEAFSRNGENTFSFDIRVDTGPQVIGVVPQPITRNNLLLSQATNQIIVYFDQAEELDSDSAEDISYYRLFEVNSGSGHDIGSVIVPTQVEYSPSDHKATLTFSAALSPDKLFRLEVGEQLASVEISQVAVGEIVIEESPLPAPEINPFNITFNNALTPRLTFTNNTAPTFAGTGRAGATVTLVVDSNNDGIPETVLNTAVVDNNDQWSITLDTDLRSPAFGGPEGRVAFFAFQTDSLGRVSPTLSSHVDIDTAQPSQPLIDLLPAQNNQTPTVTGFGEPGAALTLFGQMIVDNAPVTVEGFPVATILDQNGDELSVLNEFGMEVEVGIDGRWSVPIAAFPVLPEGDFRVVAQQRDAAGNVSDVSLSMDFEVDVTLPQPPQFDMNDINGDAPPIVRSLRPTITGTGNPGATLELRADMSPEDGNDVAVTIIGTAIVTEAGTWRIEPTQDLPERQPIGFEPQPTLLEISQTDVAGNRNPVDLDTQLRVFVDTKRPSDSAATTLKFGSVTNKAGEAIAFSLTDPMPLINNSTPLISGTGDPRATVTLKADLDSDLFAESFIATTFVNEAGQWAISLSADDINNTNLTDFTIGDYEVNDPLPEGVIELSATQVDQAGNKSVSEVTAAFRIDTIADAPVFDELSLALTKNNQPVISGTGEPGVTLTLDDDAGIPLALPVIVANNGTWQVQPLNALPDGVTKLVAVQTDLAGNVSEEGTGSIEVDATAPIAPVFDNDPFDTTNDRRPVITGTGELGAKVTLRADTDTDPNNALVPIGFAIVGADGKWSIQSTQEFTVAEGQVRVLQASQEDLVGNPSPNAQGQISFDFKASGPPTFDLLPGTNEVQPTITGKGVAGDTVVLLGDTTGDGVANAFLGKAEVTEDAITGDSTWSITSEEEIQTGDVSLVAYQVDPFGNISKSATATIIADVTAPGAPEIFSLAIQTTATPTITGLGEVGAEVTLSGDHDADPGTDNKVLGTGTVQPNGTWAIQTSKLADGTIALTATQTDVAENVGTAQGKNNVTIAATPPAAPVIDPPGFADTETPTFTGTGEANAVVYLRADISGDDTADTTIGTATVDSEGNWSITPSENLPTVDDAAGLAIVLEATQFNDLGLQSKADESSVTIDMIAPPAPTIITNGLVGIPRPPISGTGEAGATVTLLGNGAPLGTETVDNGGNWTITPGSDLPQGNVILSASQRDPADNSSPAVNGEITTDYFPPNAPFVSIAPQFFTSDKTPTILGSGELGATVTILQDKTGDGNFESTLTTVDVDGNGNWAATLPALDDTAANSLAFRQTDEGDNVSGDTTREITITAFGVPSPPLFDDLSLPQSTPIPVITGTGEADDDVELFWVHDADSSTPDIPLGTAKVAQDGTWSITPIIPLAEGSISLKAIQVNDEDQKSIPFSSQVFVDTIPPGTLTSGFSEDPFNPTPVTQNPTTNPIFEGFTQEAGETVTIDVAGVSFSTISSDEAEIALAVGLSPGAIAVFPLETNDPTPTIRGVANLDLSAGDELTVVVNSVTYTAGDGDLAYNSLAKTWSLTIPSLLPDDTYPVAASINGGAPVTADLVVDTEAQLVLPTVTPAVEPEVTPTVEGTATVAAGESLTVVVNNVTYTEGDGNLTLIAGNWSLVVPPANPLVYGANTILARVTDAAGNVAEGTGDITVGLADPTAPLVVGQITNNPTDINGFARVNVGAGDTLRVEIGTTVDPDADGSFELGVDPELTHVNATSTWELDASGLGLADGDYTVTVTVSDPDGNPSSHNDTLKIDTAAPAVAPTVAIGIFDSATPEISGTATLATGEVLTVEVNGVTYTAGDGNLTHDAGLNTWSLQIPNANALNDGTYLVTATVTDEAGNVAENNAGNGDEVGVSAVGVVTPTVVSQLTNNDEPTVTGTAVLNGGTLTVEVDGETYTAGGPNLTHDNGTNTWSLVIPPANALPSDDAYPVVATVTATDGSSVSGENTLTVDTTSVIPAPSIDAPADDFTTATPTITGTATLGAGDVLTVVVNSVTYRAGDGNLTHDDAVNTWSLVVPAGNALVNDTYLVDAKITDAAGNESDASSEDIVVAVVGAELLVPLVFPGQVLAVNTPTINGMASLSPGDVLTVEINGITYTRGEGDLTHDNTTKTWALAIPGSDALVVGTYPVIVTVTDAAGVNTASSQENIEINTSSPVAATITTASVNEPTPTIEGTATLVAGDVLTVEVDGITYTTTGNQLGLSINEITVDDGGAGYTSATVTISGGGGVGATATATIDPVTEEVTGITITSSGSGYSSLPEVTIDGDGSDATATATLVDWGLTISDVNGTYNALEDGSEVVLATVTAANGFTVSTPKTVIVNLQDVEVQGKISKSPTPEIKGKADVDTAGGETLEVEVFDGVNPPVTYTAGAGDLTLTAGGDWTLNIPGADFLSTGLYQVTARVLDNLGVLVPGHSATWLLQVDLDIPSQAIADQPPFPGSFNTPLPTITGTATLVAGDILTVEVDGVTYTADDGNLTHDNVANTWSLQIPPASALVDGNYDVTAKVTDAAENESQSIRQVAISVAGVEVPTVVSQLTSSDQPTVTGTAVLNGGTLTVEVNGETYTAGGLDLTHDNGTNTWSLVIPLANALPSDDAYPVVATVTATDGSSVSGANTLTVDTTEAIPAPSIDAPADDFTTATPTITGTATLGAGETLTVVVNSVTYTAGDGNLTHDNGANTWSLVVPAGNALVNDTYQVNAKITDAAGNESDASSEDIVVAVVGAELLVPLIVDQTINNQLPVVTGRAVVGVGETLTVEIGTALDPDANGSYELGVDAELTNVGNDWSLAIPLVDALAEDTYVVTATVTDNASGNSASGVGALTIDMTDPTPTLAITSGLLTTATPPIAGDATLTVGDVLTVAVNGVTYTAGDGNLTHDNVANTWSLVIPPANALAGGDFLTTVTVTDAAGNDASIAEDITVKLEDPIAPIVIQRIVNTASPVLNGYARVNGGAGDTLRIEIGTASDPDANGSYVLGVDAELTHDNESSTWLLDLSESVPSLAEGDYTITATVENQSGTASHVASLVVDTTGPSGYPLVDVADPIVPEATQTPTITGTATLAVGDVLTVEVDGETYTESGPDLTHDNGTNTWSLQLFH